MAGGHRKSCNSGWAPASGFRGRPATGLRGSAGLLLQKGQDGPLWRFAMMLEEHFSRVQIRGCEVTSNKNPTVCLITAEGFKGHV